MDRAALVAIIGLGAVLSTAAYAQKSSPGYQENSGMNGSLSRSDLEKLNGEHPKEQDSAAARAKARAESAKLVTTLQLPCDMTDAQLVVSGTRRPASGGREVEARVYEVACSQGMGYLLETQGSAAPLAISCLSAEEARSADEAKGKEPGFFCKLPGNKDAYALVTSLIAADAGVQCTVQKLQLFGRSESTKSEYSEVACQEGKGYLVRTPLPGSQAETTVTSCADAAEQGIKCRLTDAGPVEPRVTSDTFKEALAQHGVSCQIGQVRLIGQEDHLKRYVVEYRCADQAAGAGVAFIPLEGNTNPYEAMDCAAAATHGLACVLASAR